MEWPADRLERIGISSFGIGGTNVHVSFRFRPGCYNRDSYNVVEFQIILDSATSLGSDDALSNTNQSRQDEIGLCSKSKMKPTILLFSAASEASLARSVEFHETYCKNQPHRLDRLAQTLNHMRVDLPHRNYLVVDENGRVCSTKTASPLGPQTRAWPGSSVPITFIFSGAGREWTRIGVELLRFDKTFADDIRRMDDALQNLLPADRPSWSLRGEMLKTGDRSRLGDTRVGSTVLTAIQIALTRLLGRHGVCPDGVAGYSTGKIAADHAFGILSVEEAICLALYTSKASPNNHISASRDGFDIDTQQLGTSTPGSLAARGQKFAQPSKTDDIYDCIRGSSAVAFSQQVQSLLSRVPGSIHLVIGPHASIVEHLEQTYKEAGLRPTQILTLVRGRSATITFLAALGELYCNGVLINLPASNGNLMPLVDLEPYPWDLTKHYWPESRVSKSWRLRRFPQHELIGVRNFDDGGDTSAIWRSALSADKIPWLKDHRIGNDIVFPAAAFVAMAGEACLQLTGNKAYVVKEVSLKKALILVPGATVELVTSARSQSHQCSGPDTWDMSFSSLEDSMWTTHCTAIVKSTTAPNLGTASLLGMEFPETRDGFVRQVDPPSW
jgi:acyl transferase domain-containing protein